MNKYSVSYEYRDGAGRWHAVVGLVVTASSVARVQWSIATMCQECVINSVDLIGPADDDTGSEFDV